MDTKIDNSKDKTRQSDIFIDKIDTEIITH